LPYFSFWIGAVFLYSAFWTAVIAFVVSKNRAGESRLAVLLLTWGAFTLIIPAGVAELTEAVYPTPSPATYLAQAREVEIQTELEQDEAEGRFTLDHPEMMINSTSEVPGYFRTSFLATSAADQATRPTLLAFEKAIADRENALSMLRYLSPAIFVHGFLNATAGTSSERHRGYVAQARTFKAEYATVAGAYVVSGSRLPLATAESLPHFQFRDASVHALLSDHAITIWCLMLVALGLFLAAHRRLSLGSPLA
jgi:hypothetical protein